MQFYAVIASCGLFGSVLNELVNRVTKRLRFATPLHFKWFRVCAQQDLNGGMGFVFINPVHMITGNLGEDGWANYGIVSPIWRHLGVGGMARGGVDRRAPPVAIRT